MKYALMAAGFAALCAANTATASPAAAQGVSVHVGPGGVGIHVGKPHRRGKFHGWGPGYHYRGGYYYGDCAWLRARARDTGNPTWWRRYHKCRSR